MAVNFLTGELVTGHRLTQLPVVDGSWAPVLNGAGTIEAKLKLDDEKVRARPELLLALEPARSFLAAVSGDSVIEAGPIWSHVYDDTTKVLTVRAGGLRSVFDHRIVMKILATGEDPALAVMDYTGTLADIARDLVRLALSHTGGSLPIVFEADEGGTSDERTYLGHELARVGDRLNELTGVIGGPDLAFEPQLTADRQGLQWVMRTGTSDDPLLHQPGSSSSYGDADWVWDVRAKRSGVQQIDVTRDANKLAYRAWASGQGTGESLLIAVEEDDTLIARGYPLLESVTQHQSVVDSDTLDAYATSDLIAAMRPWTTWTLKVRADANPQLGTYRPGDWARVWIPDDHLYLSQFYPAGFYRTRILGFSGGTGPDVTINLAPTMDVR